MKLKYFTDLHSYFLCNCLNLCHRKIVCFPYNSAERKNRNDLNHRCRVVDPRDSVPNSKYCCKIILLFFCLIKTSIFLMQLCSCRVFIFKFIHSTYFYHNNWENKLFVRIAHRSVFEHFHSYCLHLHKQIIVSTFSCAFHYIN